MSRHPRVWQHKRRLPSQWAPLQTRGLPPRSPRARSARFRCPTSADEAREPCWLSGVPDAAGALASLRAPSEGAAPPLAAGPPSVDAEPHCCCAANGERATTKWPGVTRHAPPAPAAPAAAVFSLPPALPSGAALAACRLCSVLSASCRCRCADCSVAASAAACGLQVLAAPQAASVLLPPARPGCMARGLGTAEAKAAARRRGELPLPGAGCRCCVGGGGAGPCSCAEPRAAIGVDGPVCGRSRTCGEAGLHAVLFRQLPQRCSGPLKTFHTS